MIRLVLGFVFGCLACLSAPLQTPCAANDLSLLHHVRVAPTGDVTPVVAGDLELMKEILSSAPPLYLLFSAAEDDPGAGKTTLVLDQRALSVESVFDGSARERARRDWAPSTSKGATGNHHAGLVVPLGTNSFLLSKDPCMLLSAAPSGQFRDATYLEGSLANWILSRNQTAAAAVTIGDGFVWLYDILDLEGTPSAHLRDAFPHEFYVRLLDVSDDGRHVLFLEDHRTVVLWPPTRGVPEVPDGQRILRAAMHQDGLAVLSSSVDSLYVSTISQRFSTPFALETMRGTVGFSLGEHPHFGTVVGSMEQPRSYSLFVWSPPAPPTMVPLPRGAVARNVQVVDTRRCLAFVVGASVVSGDSSDVLVYVQEKP